MRGTPAILNGEIARPHRTEAEVREARRKKLIAEACSELAQERWDREDAEAEENYAADALHIWNRR